MGGSEVEDDGNELAAAAWAVIACHLSASFPEGAFFCPKTALARWSMATRVALIGIVVENLESVEKLNAILHQYGEYIIGRMGIPYRERRMSIISVAVDAPEDVISAMAGRLGMLPGVSAKIIYAKKDSPPTMA